MAEQKPRRLLNPFAFPSETQLRSILLIWAILGLCWLVGFTFAKALLDSRGWPAVGELPRLDPSLLQIDEATPKSPSSPEDIRAWWERTGPAYPDLKEPGGLARILAALADLSKAAHLRLKVIQPYFAIPFLFLVLALLCILVHYVVRIWRLWLSRVSSRSGEQPEFQNTLRTLIQEVQEQQRRQGESPIPYPRFFFSQGAKGDGQAFGTSRRPVILLTRAMPAILKEDIRDRGEPYKFRAWLFHELAHLANRDVTRSCWAEASWIVFVPVLTLLVATLLMLRPSWGALIWLFQAGARVMAIMLVIELIRRSILRDREHEADLWASLLWNTGAPLRSSLPDDETDPSSPSVLQKLLARLRRKHPTTAERLEILDHPNRALVLSMDVPFLAGLLFGNLIGSILVLAAVIVLAMSAVQTLMTNSIIEDLVHSHGPAMAMRLYSLVGIFLWVTLMSVSAFALFCAVSYLLAGTLGVQVQRESMLQMVEADQNPHPYRALLKPAFLTAAGFAIGLILVPMAPALPRQAWEFLSLIGWVLFAALLFWGWLSAIRFFARRLLGTHFSLRKPVRQIRMVTWASAILLWPLILILLGGQFWMWPVIQAVWAMVLWAIGLLGFLLLLMLLALAIREVRREERRPQCPHPHCGSEVLAASAAADCVACGNSLAPWLFIQEPSTLEAGKI